MEGGFIVRRAPYFKIIGILKKYFDQGRWYDTGEEGGKDAIVSLCFYTLSPVALGRVTPQKIYLAIIQSISES